MTLALRSAARSDVGLIRAGNEDSGYAGPALLVVADGMGGHAAGELASATAVATLAEFDPSGTDDLDHIARLSDAVALTSERIADVVSASPELAGMGTTVTALAWLDNPPRVALVHVGDSRGYLLRDGEFAQITRDHTYVQSLVDSGEITAEEALVHPRRSLLMRAIDGVHPAEPDVSVREARLGDRYLLCSDGLSGYVDEADIAELMAVRDSTAAVTAMVEAALENGAPDNVTCVIGDVVDVPDHPDRIPLPAVVVGAAGEQRNRDRLPTLIFPADAQPDVDRHPDGSHSTLLRVSSATRSDDSGAAAVARVYAEEQPARSTGRRGRIIALLLGIALALSGVAASYVVWARDQWYVGESNGYVSVFQGVPGSIGPIELHRVSMESTVRVDSLPAFEADQVRATIYATSEVAAQATVERLRGRAAQCTATPTVAGCPAAIP